MDKQRLFRLIESDYQLLKQYENGECHGANGRRMKPSVTAFVSVVERFYSYVDTLSEVGFSPRELDYIGGCRSAVNRESQNNNIHTVMRVLMYDVEDVMTIVKSKLCDSE